MKLDQHIGKLVILLICLLSLCSCGHSQEALIEYDENLSQQCNYYNSGLIQEYKGVFYELKSEGIGFLLYQGNAVNKIINPMNISVASSGFRVYNDQILYKSGENGNEIRSVNIDGTEDNFLFAAPVQEFVPTDDGIYWSDKLSKNLMYYDFNANKQTEITNFPVFCIQQVDGKVSFLSESDSNTDYYEQTGTSSIEKILTFAEPVYKYVRKGEKLYAFADYSIYEGNLTDDSLNEIITNFHTLDTSVNVFDGKVVFCGLGEEGSCTYLYDPEHQNLVVVDDKLHQFIFSFDSGLWEYSLNSGFQRLKV